MNKTHSKINKKGFALVEALVAILIISAMCATAFEVLAKMSVTVSGVKNEFIAYHLANEAIELVHNAKDRAYENWVVDPSTSINSDSPDWGVDTSGLTDYVNSKALLPSNFSRAVIFDALGTDDTRGKVTVTVSWDSGMKFVKLSTILFK